VDALQEAGKHEYLFQQAKAAVTAADERAQRQAEAERIAKMTPLQRLELANARKFAEMGRQ
jgi:hypothetical protein